MIVVCTRTLIFFIVLWLLLKLMGKRQIGELTAIEFISAMMLSELAIMPMSDPDVPLLYGILPVLLIGSCEVLIAAICKKFGAARRLIQGEPVPLVRCGAILQENCVRARISEDEIMMTLRCEGYSGLDQVSEVTLERTGRMSVLPK